MLNMYLSESIFSAIADGLQVRQTNGTQLNSAQLRNEFFTLAAYFSSKTTSDEVVAIFLDRDYRYLLTVLALIYAGVTFVPLNKSWPKKHLEKILRIVNPVFIIGSCTEDGETTVSFVSYESIIESRTPSKKKPSVRNSHLNKTMYVIFTSGSTGDPKGVRVSRASFENFVSWVDEVFVDINSNDRLINTAEHTFDFSLLDVALLISKKLEWYYSQFKNNIWALAGEIARIKPTVMCSVPNNVQMLISPNVLARTDLSSLQHLLLGGSRFSFGLYNKIFKIFPSSNIYNLYGPTEATVFVTVAKLCGAAGECIKEAVTVGKETKGNTIFVINEEMEELPAHTYGEVVIAGRQIMEGYVNLDSSDTMMESFRERQIYHTRDIGYKDHSGNLFIVGRMDDTYKVSGYRVNLGDIDSVVESLDYVVSSACIAIPDEIREYSLVLFLTTNIVLSTDTIMKDLETILPKYQLPKQICLLPEMPKNSSGKISKGVLSRLVIGGKAAWI